MIFTQIEISAFLETLLSQSALVVLMGFVSYVLWKKLEDSLDKKDKLAEALIKISLLWEERYSKESSDDKENRILLSENRQLLHEIIELIKSARDAK